MKRLLGGFLLALMFTAAMLLASCGGTNEDASSDEGGIRISENGNINDFPAIDVRDLFSD